VNTVHIDPLGAFASGSLLVAVSHSTSEKAIQEALESRGAGNPNRQDGPEEEWDEIDRGFSKAGLAGFSSG